MGEATLAVTVFLGLGVALLVWSRRNEIFCVSVRDGRTLVVRGAVPPGLLHGISDVVARERVARGTVRAVRAQTHARLVTSGMGADSTQRLRNVFGHHSVQKLRAAALPGPRNLGQWLGVAWLAWLLTHRDR